MFALLLTDKQYSICNLYKCLWHIPPNQISYAHLQWFIWYRPVTNSWLRISYCYLFVLRFKNIALTKVSVSRTPSMIQHFITVHQVMLVSLPRHKSAMFLLPTIGSEKRSRSGASSRKTFNQISCRTVKLSNRWKDTRTHTKAQTAWLSHELTFCLR
jgi:hypothetical protein